MHFGGNFKAYFLFFLENCSVKDERYWIWMNCPEQNLILLVSQQRQST
jgi:hypothetical protein